MIMRNSMVRHFHRNYHSTGIKILWAYLASAAVQPIRLWLIGYLNINDIQIISPYWCFRYLRADWTATLVTNDMEHIIKRPSIGHITLWADNYLKYIIPSKPHQIWTLPMVWFTLWNWDKAQKELLDYNSLYQQPPTWQKTTYSNTIQSIWRIYNIHLSWCMHINIYMTKHRHKCYTCIHVSYFITLHCILVFLIIFYSVLWCHSIYLMVSYFSYQICIWINILVLSYIHKVKI